MHVQSQSRASSIDTPLHAFIPAKFVDHMHPNSVIAIAASRHSERLTKEIFGDRVGWVPWLRPGFELGLLMQRTVEANPSLVGLVMGQHGLINWADDDRACYERTLSLIDQAAEFIESKDKGELTFGGQRYEPLGPEAARRFSWSSCHGYVVRSASSNGVLRHCKPTRTFSGL